MSDKGPKDIEKTDCCSQGECCSSSTINDKQQPGNRIEWWKIAVFTLGMLMVIAGISYSLITRHSGASSNVVGNGVVSSVPSSACVTLGIGELAWAKDLDAVFVKTDFVFVVLPGSDGDSGQELTYQVDGVAEKIQTQGLNVRSMILSPNDPEFSKTTENLAISQLPAVLILGKNGNGAILVGNLDESKLLEAYLVVSQAPPCIPGSSGGCCP
jgi:hypothetical protein